MAASIQHSCVNPHTDTTSILFFDSLLVSHLRPSKHSMLPFKRIEDSAVFTSVATTREQQVGTFECGVKLDYLVRLSHALKPEAVSSSFSIVQRLILPACRAHRADRWERRSRSLHQSFFRDP